MAARLDPSDTVGQAARLVVAAVADTVGQAARLVVAAVADTAGQAARLEVAAVVDTAGQAARLEVAAVVDTAGQAARSLALKACQVQDHRPLVVHLTVRSSVQHDPCASMRWRK